MTTRSCRAESAELNRRISEQQQALADLAIERRRDKLYMTNLRLEKLELEHRIDRMEEALRSREAELARLRERLQRALGTARGAQQALARLRRVSSL